MRDHKGCFCGLGALIEVVDPSYYDDNPQVAMRSVMCPQIGQDTYINAAFVSAEQQEVIVCLNDSDKWTLPRIADWVEANVPVNA